jgi:hypothetical protein
MKRRNKKHKPFHASVPMLINRMLNDQIEGREEFAMLHAFQFGKATRGDYDYLVRMANMLNCAAQTKGVHEVAVTVDSINFLAQLILERYERTSKFGVNSDELVALRSVVAFYDAFWKRQTTTLYNDCVAELNAFYAEIKEKRAA